MMDGSDQFNVQKFTQRRFKRDNLLATENSDDDHDEQTISPKRMLKVRRRKITKKVTEPEIQSSMEDSSQTISVNPTRRRIVVTKSRRLKTEEQSNGELMTTSFSPDYVKTDAETQQIPKRLRIKTVTRRKLIKPTSMQTTLNAIVTTSTYQSIDVPFNTDDDDDDNDRPILNVKKLPSTNLKNNPITTSSPQLPIIQTPSHLSYTTTTEYYDTIVKTTTRLRTFTYVVTRVHDNESQIMSTTTVREQTKPVTETLTRTSTFTLQIPIVVIPTTLDQSNSFIQQTTFNDMPQAI